MATRKKKTIYMKAFSKQRPRVTKRGTYMPRQYVRKKTELKYGFGSVPSGPVRLTIKAVRQMPSSWSKTKRSKQLGQPTITTPDIDNIAGAVMDSLFSDDRFVVELHCRKVWGHSHQLVISVEQI